MIRVFKGQSTIVKKVYVPSAAENFINAIALSVNPGEVFDAHAHAAGCWVNRHLGVYWIARFYYEENKPTSECVIYGAKTKNIFYMDIDKTLTHIKITHDGEWFKSRECPRQPTAKDYLYWLMDNGLI